MSVISGVTSRGHATPLRVGDSGVFPGVSEQWVFRRGIGVTIDGVTLTGPDGVRVLSGGINGPWEIRAPSWAERYTLFGIGAGGGGAGRTPASAMIGGGGGSGLAILDEEFTCIPNESINVAVGAGGVAGANAVSAVTSAGNGLEGSMTYVSNTFRRRNLTPGAGGKGATPSAGGAGGGLFTGLFGGLEPFASIVSHDRRPRTLIQHAGQPSSLAEIATIKGAADIATGDIFGLTTGVAMFCSGFCGTTSKGSVSTSIAWGHSFRNDGCGVPGGFIPQFTTAIGGVDTGSISNTVSVHEGFGVGGRSGALHNVAEDGSTGGDGLVILRFTRGV